MASTALAVSFDQPSSPGPEDVLLRGLRPFGVCPYFGGKTRLADKIRSLMPPRFDVLVDPFLGAGSVPFWTLGRWSNAVLNDLDEHMVDMYRVLRDPVLRARFDEAMCLTPFSETEFRRCLDVGGSDDVVERARRQYVVCTWSLRHTPQCPSFGSVFQIATGFRSWRGSYRKRLAAIADVLDRSVIHNTCALKVVDRTSRFGPGYVAFCDPPYVLSTRVGVVSDYRHECDDSFHADLLDLLRGYTGRVVLCGYGSRLYEDRLGDWPSFSFGQKYHWVAADGSVVASDRIERVWINFSPDDGLPLFAGRRAGGGLLAV